MSRQVEFFFDFGSPTTYLAYTQLPKIAAAHKALILWRPMLLGGVFKATGNVSPATVPAKSRWMDGDMKLWARRYGVPFERNPDFPINTLTLMRGAVGMQAQMPEDFPRYVETVFNAMWVRPRNLNLPEEVTRMLRDGGFAVDRLIAMTADPAVKEQLKKNTEEAVERGVFGAPTFFVGEQMFFGQDRLEMVAGALQS